jgi:hypothetical protein
MLTLVCCGILAWVCAIVHADLPTVEAKTFERANPQAARRVAYTPPPLRRHVDESLSYRSYPQNACRAAGYDGVGDDVVSQRGSLTLIDCMRYDAPNRQVLIGSIPVDGRRL